MALFGAALQPSPTILKKTHIQFSFPILLSDETSLRSLQRSNPHSTGGRMQRWRLRGGHATAVCALFKPDVDLPQQDAVRKGFRILIAGGGIGGLVFALAAKRKGFDVMVFEKDLSAIRGEGQYRGPIQIQSNALAALEAIDMEVAEEVMETGCITGDRINGLVDGVSGTWYIKFDTYTPAVERGLPVTRVISRMALQQILARAVGHDIIMNDSNVVDFVDDGNKVTVILENGQQYEGDLLVGADGIWSKVRRILFGYTDASYSGYTCYTGIADFVPPDIDIVGYRVFLGHKQYFVSSDVGAGKMQWYAFHKEPPGGSDVQNGKKERLLKIFCGWCDNVIDLINATEEEVILRRDIYDRIPISTWGKGRVTLLGDAVHAMQPNMGQGGCMAIEDSYQLALELEKAWKNSIDNGKPMDVASPLKRYEEERRLRVAIIYGMARMAAIMASTYRPYLGVGLGPLSFLTKLKIPHPGRVGGRFFIKYAMPLMLNWVLGGNRWYLFPVNSTTVQPIHLTKDRATPYIFGSASHDGFREESIHLPFPQVAEAHAHITYEDNAFYLTDLQSEHATWITDNEGRRQLVPPNFPVRFHPSYVIEFGSDKKAMFRVKVLSKSQETPAEKILRVV
ncbi:Zeaxanthin epoxidase, chloroplastic [Apostasia shenzhenica]|uniref:Zeaxanthin epoxidase, chloroplastic n=1 Tax=Apostasia shenzhenica TaxID=1088818 RepID=A0A2I0AKM3_9ASPA|nr:Zeaxanthin epoxidase, chloroplastic [Apostasia shenzhenica]